MAKIELPDNLLSGLVPSLYNKRADKKKDVGKTKVFSKAYKDADEANAVFDTQTEPVLYTDASTMLDAVHESGNDIKKNPSIENIKKYKSAVRNFISYVVDNAYDVVEKTSGGNILKRKKFTSLVVIDEKLERLAADIMLLQKDKFEVLKRVDEIYGLLVDLLS